LGVFSLPKVEAAALLSFSSSAEPAFGGVLPPLTAHEKKVEHIALNEVIL
jgi:hypothetical protein